MLILMRVERCKPSLPHEAAIFHRLRQLLARVARIHRQLT